VTVSVSDVKNRNRLVWTASGEVSYPVNSRPSRRRIKRFATNSSASSSIYCRGKGGDEFLPHDRHGDLIGRDAKSLKARRGT